MSPGTPTAPASEAQRGRRWLLDVVERAVATSDLGALLRVLLGVWVCERAPAAGTASGDLRSVAVCVEGRLDAEVRGGRFDPAAHDTKLLLLCQRILTALSLEAPGIAAFAAELADALRCLPAPRPRYAGEMVLLARLGLCPEPAPCALPEDALEDGLVVLRAGPDELRGLCDQVAIATHFGCRPMDRDLEVAGVYEPVLPVVVLQSLRDYQLETATMILRTIAYLGAAHAHATVVALDFLRRQQRPDGSFGFFAMEAERLRAAGGHDPVLDLWLPTTVSALWTLAECREDGFRLFGSAASDYSPSNIGMHADSGRSSSAASTAIPTSPL